MELYIHGYSRYAGDIADLDLKKVLKEQYGLDTRRQDDFIYLAVYGAQKLKENVAIKTDDELYLTSGAGNMDIIARVNDSVFEKKQAIMPFDFINMLGNTTSYYVAASLKIDGKNIFQISNNFTYIRSLTSIYSSLFSSRNDAIFGAIDMVSKNEETLKRVLGVDEKCRVISGVNYQKLSLNPKGALAKLEFDLQNYTASQIREIYETRGSEFLFSSRCKEFSGKEESGFFENMITYHINTALQEGRSIVYVDCYEQKYQMVKLQVLE
jgi:hypothetical protein